MKEPSKHTQSRASSKKVVRPATRKVTKVTRATVTSSKVTAKRASSTTKVQVAQKKPAKKASLSARVAPKKKPASKTASKAIKTTSKTVIKVGGVRGARGPLASRTKKPGKLKRRIAPSVAIKVLQRVPPPPPPEPPRRQPSTGVLKSFEQAVRVFNRRQFSEARELFEAMQSRYPQEVEINARSQTYIQVCNQKLARPLSSPRSADELYDRGVVALNIGDFTQARTLFEKALRMRPDEPHLLYSLAATYAQTGSHDQALDFLHRSIQMQPRYRNQVINDSDFSQLHHDKRFLDILGVSSPFDLFDSLH